jgi:hypothetical protein
MTTDKKKPSVPIWRSGPSKVYSELGQRLKKSPHKSLLAPLYHEAGLAARSLKSARMYADWQRIYDEEFSIALGAGNTKWRADKLAVSKIMEKYSKYSRRHIRRNITPN